MASSESSGTESADATGPMPGDGKLGVFISYSREDLAFADQLDVTLGYAGFATKLDRTSLSGAERWKERLGALISESDTVVFVLSPASARSETCQWEVSEAVHVGKRVIPVVCRPLGDVPPPVELQDLNYIFFYEEPKKPGSSYRSGADELVTALKVDLRWLREGTRYLQRATEWDHGGRSTDRLLIGVDVAEAKAWIGRRPKDAPAPTALHLAFIRASEEHEADRQTARERELSEREKLLAAQTVAVEREAAAQAERKAAIREAQVTQSGLLSQVAMAISDQPFGGDPTMAMLLTLEAIKDEASQDNRQTDRAWVPEARIELDRAVRQVRELRVFGHDEEVTAISWSPDGRLLATGSSGNTARVFDVEANAEMGRFLCAGSHDYSVSAIEWSPDGRLLATSGGNTVRVLDLGSMAEVASIAHDGHVTKIAWCSDGRLLATASWVDKESSTARVFDVSDMIEVAHFPHDERIRTLTWSPDGRFLATGSYRKTSQVFDLDSKVELARFTHDSDIRAIAWCSSGRLLAVLSNNARKTATALVLDVAAQAAITRFALDGGVTNAMFSPDRRFLATKSWDQTSRVFDVATHAEVARFALEYSALSIVWSPDGRLLAIGGHNTVQVFDLTGKAEVARFTMDDGVNVIAWRSDGRLLAVGLRDGTARALDVVANPEMARFDHDRPIKAIAWSPDGRTLATASDLTVRVFDLVGQAEATQFVQDHHVWALTWSPDGRSLGTSALDGTVRVLDLVNKTEALLVRVAHDESFNRIAWSPTGQFLAMASKKVTLVFDITAKLEWARFTREGRSIEIEWSPDGRSLALTATDKTALVIDVGSKAEVARFADDHGVHGIAWSPDGRFFGIVAGERDRPSLVRIFDVGSNAEVARFAHDDGVNEIAWSPNGRLVATAGTFGTAARVFNVDSKAEVIRFEHNNSPAMVKWSPDGRFLLTRHDGIIHVFDVNCRLKVAQFRDNCTFNHAIAWNPLPFSDGSIILGTGSKNAARLWQVYATTQLLVDTAKARATRGLTQAQRRRYFLPPAPPTWYVERRLWPYHSDDWQAWLPKQKEWLASGRQGNPPRMPDKG